MKHLEIKVLGRKSLAITLAVAIAMTTISINNLSVRAESTMETLVQGQTSINEISEGKETILNTTQQFEEDNKVLINTIEETNKIEESNSLDSSTDLEESESLETVSNNGIECEVLETITLSATVDTIRIVAKAEQGVLPENAILQVEEIITTEVIESAVEDTITSMEKIQEIKSYDIKIMSDGIEVQPEEGTLFFVFVVEF